MVGAGYFLGVFVLIFKGLPLFAASISNMVFPEPLSKEEEIRYFEILHGCPHSDPAPGITRYEYEHARNTIIEHNLRLITLVQNKMDMSNAQKEELFSLGALGLIKAVDTFDPARGTRFATYAIPCIRNEILMYLRKRGKCKAEVSLEEPLAFDKQGNSLKYLDVLENDGESVQKQVESKLMIKEVGSKLDRLSELEQRVLEIRYGLKTGKECTQQKTAEILNISRSYVSRIEKKAIQALRSLALKHEGNLR